MKGKNAAMIRKTKIALTAAALTLIVMNGALQAEQQRHHPQPQRSLVSLILRWMGIELDPNLCGSHTGGRR